MRVDYFEIETTNYIEMHGRHRGATVGGLRFANSFSAKSPDEPLVLPEILSVVGCVTKLYRVRMFINITVVIWIRVCVHGCMPVCVCASPHQLYLLQSEDWLNNNEDKGHPALLCRPTEASHHPPQSPQRTTTSPQTSQEPTQRQQVTVLLHSWW